MPLLSLADFGHGSMTVNGRPALGTRPLLAVLVDYTNWPPLLTSHALTYYDQLVFGSPTPPFSTSNNPASLTAYFTENSSGRFNYQRVGLVGPLAGGDFDFGATAGARARTVMKMVTTADPSTFFQLDANADLLLAEDELNVFLVENIAGAFPGIATNDEFSFDVTIPLISIIPVKVRVRVAGGGPKTPFYQFAHELSHHLRTIDLYNMGGPGIDPQANTLMTLMGSYSFTSDDQGTVHLETWHKMQLGWAEPRIRLFSEPGTDIVHDNGPDGSLLLYDDTWRAKDYFIVERRRPNGPRQYDASMPGNGVCIWRIRSSFGQLFVQNLAPPDLRAGASGMWVSGRITPDLRTTQDPGRHFRILVSDAGNGRMNVTWGPEVIHVSAVKHKWLFHGGNSTDGLGALTQQGIFFGVTAGGDLEWNRYGGRGESWVDVPPGNRSWDPRSGHRIGNGFGHLKHVLACGDGVFLAVQQTGEMHWLRYDGTGTNDPTGTLDWAPNSGNVIHSGFGGFERIFVSPLPGGQSRMNIFAIDSDGVLRWFRYLGNGEADPTGATGWHLNSGNPIGRGFQGVRHAHGSSTVLFIVTGDGVLRWYNYTGSGAADPTGGLGWDPKSGNAIGNGWQDQVHVFGGVTDAGGFAHTVYAVGHDGDMRWFRYTGQGEADINGVLGWGPRSGNVIGRGW